MGLLSLGLVNPILDQFLPEVALVEAMVVGLVEITLRIAIMFTNALFVVLSPRSAGVLVGMGVVSG